jgi:hypothetical protein
LSDYEITFTTDELEWVQDVTDRVLQGADVSLYIGKPAGATAVRKILDAWESRPVEY